VRTLPIVIVLAACGASQAPVAPPPPASEHEPPPVEERPPIPPSEPQPPATKTGDAADTYHGVTVRDPYRWLEGDGSDVAAWSAAQNAYARDILDALPDVAALRRELHDIIAAPITTYRGFESAGGKLFAFRKLADHEQPDLVVITDPTRADSVHLVLDPTANGGTAQQTIDWFVPSPDGSKLAVSISQGGSEHGDLHIVDLAGTDLEPAIPNVQQGTGGGAVAWTPDGKGLYYTRYPKPGERPDSELAFWLQIYFHQLGTPAGRDRYELGKDFPKIAEVLLDSDRRGRVIASVQLGDGGTFRHYLRDARGWRQLDDWSDGITFAGFGPTDDLYLVSQHDAPHGKVLRLAGDARSAAAAKQVIAEGTETIIAPYDIHDLLVTRDRILATYQLGGPSELRAFTLAGAPAKSPQLPAVSSVSFPVPWRDGVLIASSSYTTPRTISQVDLATGAMTTLAPLSPAPPVDLSTFVVTREVATSKDGTKIPLDIIWPAHAPHDGSTPCVITGYGGYAISRTPSFLATWAPVLTRGVCVVDVNLRGGKEFGEAWHQAGALVHKQNVFDDFAAALQYLIANRYTSAQHLGIIGGSNGGLLMGAMITQHPDLMAVVVSSVGIYDMVRTELSPNGAYNAMEYGSTADPDQFAALYAYSPYHHVVAGTRYPAILMTTGANDPRVSPWQSRKMIAALQAARAGDAPILLRTSDKAGHGMGSSMTEQIELLAHEQAFLLAHVR
jgi:prolyl oligopeptidase